MYYTIKYPQATTQFILNSSHPSIFIFQTLVANRYILNNRQRRQKCQPYTCISVTNIHYMYPPLSPPVDIVSFLLYENLDTRTAQ